MLHYRILQTLRLFGLQYTAVTLLELHKFLVADVEEIKQYLDAAGELIDAQWPETRSVSLTKVLSAMDDLVSGGQVSAARGFYALAGYKEHLDKRWLGHYFGSFREERIHKFVYGLKYLPFIRGVALAGSQALGLARKESDIDLLIITARGWVWLPRTFATAYFQIFGVRRHKALIANRFCLNHYISETKTMMRGRNWYTGLEYGKLRPLVYHERIMDFQRANLNWLRVFFPNLPLATVKVGQRAILQIIFELLFSNKLGHRLEVALGSWQIRRIHLDDPHTAASNDELFFSPHSKEDKVVPAFLRG